MTGYIHCIDGCRHIRVLSTGRMACFRYPGNPEGPVAQGEPVVLAEQVYPLVEDDTIACGEFQRPDWRVEIVIRKQEMNADAA